MSAWQLLTDNSDAPVGSDAWAHLNSQQGGGETVVIVGGLRTADKPVALSSRLDWAMNADQRSTVLSADKPVALSAQIHANLEASVCQ